MIKKITSIVAFTMFCTQISLSFSFASDAASKKNTGFKTTSFIAPEQKNSLEGLRSFLQSESSKLTNTQTKYVLKSKKTEANGNTVYKVQQNYNNIPVFGYSKNIVMTNSGKVKSVSGWDLPLLEKTNLDNKDKVTPITSSDAKKIAIKDLGFTPTGNVHTKCSTQLYIQGNAGYCCHVLNISFLEPAAGNWYYFIDCFNGNIINKYNHLDTVADTNILNTGKGVSGNLRNFNAVKSPKGFFMQDITRGKGIFTYNGNFGIKIPGKLYSNPDPEWNSASLRAAVDAHYFAEVTYDFYKKYFGRNSYDDKGSPIKSTVHYQNGYNNAFWNGDQMVYGDGDGKTFLPLSGALDVVAHELTHAFTSSEVELVYQGESGAISESLSDIFATLVEYDTQPNGNWLMGESIFTPSIKGDALRSLSNPEVYGDPDNYAKKYTGSQDNYGVHKNCSIINKAAYLISEGGTHYGVSVKGIGRKKLGDILYRTVCFYLTPNSTFSQFRACAVQSAEDLYGSNSKEVTAVSKAFDSVGVE